MYIIFVKWVHVWNWKRYLFRISSQYLLMTWMNEFLQQNNQDTLYGTVLVANSTHQPANADRRVDRVLWRVPPAEGTVRDISPPGFFRITSTTWFISGRPKELGIQQSWTMFHSGSLIHGWANRFGRSPFMTRRITWYSPMFAKGIASKNICTSLSAASRRWKTNKLNSPHNKGSRRNRRPFEVFFFSSVYHTHYNRCTRAGHIGCTHQIALERRNLVSMLCQNP